MIRMPVAAQDLAETRLIYTPLWEAVLSYRAVACPDRPTLPVPWAMQLGRDAARIDLRPLRAALADRTVLFVFLFPMPSGHDVGFDEQLEQLRATDPDDVAEQVIWHFESMDEAPVPELRPFLDRPRSSIDRLASALTSYWEGAFRPHWPRLRAVLEADLLHRGKVVAVHGAAPMLRGLHPEIPWREHGLDIDRPVDWRG